MGAVISPCGTWRYTLTRYLQGDGPIFAYFGVNGSTATADDDDQTVRKWTGFTKVNGGSAFVVGNPFAYRATNVRELAHAADPVGPENALYLRQIIMAADILVPCWGNRNKVPLRLQHHFDALLTLIFESGKPVKHFGLTARGDPKHVLMLGYATPLVDWAKP